MIIKNRKKYGIFISSTYRDLIEERKVASNAIIESGHIPMGMELFTPDGQSSVDVIKASIDNSDFLLLIIAGKYGSTCVDNGAEKSYVEMEYDYAKQTHKPVLLFFHEDISILPRYKTEDSTKRKAKLDSFLKRVQKDVYGKTYKEINTLEKEILKALQSISTREYESSGWIRVKDISQDVLNMDSESCTPFIVFSQEKRPANSLQSEILKGASKFYFFVKTGVSFFSAHERLIIELINNGCEFRFLTVREEYVKAIQGQEDLDMYHTNISKTKQHLKRIYNAVEKNHENIKIRVVDYVPTISMNYVEKGSNDKIIMIQQYFVNSRIGKDRPMFILKSDNEWFSAYYDELMFLWNKGNDWDINT